jgi:hypothetical protein
MEQIQIPDRPAFRTASGLLIPLPGQLHYEEFAMPGNSRETANLVGIFDGISQTGAYWTPKNRFWCMFGPVLRADFFAMLEVMDAVLARRDWPQEGPDIASMLPGGTA